MKLQSFPVESAGRIEAEKKPKPQVRVAMERAFNAAGIHDPAQKQRLRKLFNAARRSVELHGASDQRSERHIKSFHAEIDSPIKSKLFSIRFGQVGRKLRRAQRSLGEISEK